MPVTCYTEKEYKDLERKLLDSDKECGRLTAEVSRLKKQIEELKRATVPQKSPYITWSKEVARILDNLGFKVSEITNEEELMNWHEDNLRPEEAVSEMFRP